MQPITRTGAVLAAALTCGALAGTAQAASPTWQCHASAVSASLTGNPAVDPVSSTAAPCVSNATGAGNLSTPLGLPAGFLTSGTTSATTFATPADEIPARQGVGAVGRVEGLALQLPPGSPSTTLGIREANAQATAVCVAGQRVLDGSSESTGITLGGQEVPIDEAARQLSAAFAPLGQAVDLKANEQVVTAGSLTQNAVHLRILSAAGTPVLDVVAGQARVGFDGDVCNPAGQVAGSGNGNGNGGNGGNGTAGSAASAILANGVRGSTCGHLTMYFARNHKRAITSRYGNRVVARGRVVNCKGKAIVRARIDVIHVVNGKRKLVKTGLRSRDKGQLTLILPSNLRTRDVRFEYRGNLLSSKVTSRSTLHVKVRNRHGRVVR
ncbi:MAG: hypothetical protein QOC78_1175 [Solirubrobacteraceae bacterium]|jgi:hypothetical protein|nr:hypothetical protein [Solirubrobacteraceae bacterium]